jgi:hypothetical protein
MKKQHISTWLKPSEDEALTKKSKEKAGYVNLYILRLLEDSKLENLNPSDLRFLAKEGAVQKVFPVPEVYKETVDNFKETVDLMKSIPTFRGYRISIQVVLRSLILKELGL